MTALAPMLPRPWSRSLEPRAAVDPIGRRSPLARVAATLARAYRLRRDTRQLMALDDDLLSDMGLSRGEIERAARLGRDWR